MGNEISDQESGHLPDYCLETISLRLYDPRDMDRVLDAFQRISLQLPQGRFFLFRNASVDSDWSIHLWGPVFEEWPHKSPAAVCLSDLLREIGIVHHSVWFPLSGDQIPYKDQ